jgi:hypothetical protein
MLYSLGFLEFYFSILYACFQLVDISIELCRHIAVFQWSATKDRYEDKRLTWRCMLRSHCFVERYLIWTWFEHLWCIQLDDILLDKFLETGTINQSKGLKLHIVARDRNCNCPNILFDTLKIGRRGHHPFAKAQLLWNKKFPDFLYIFLIALVLMQRNFFYAVNSPTY